MDVELLFEPPTSDSAKVIRSESPTFTAGEIVSVSPLEQITQDGFGNAVSLFEITKKIWTARRAFRNLDESPTTNIRVYTLVPTFEDLDASRSYLGIAVAGGIKHFGKLVIEDERWRFDIADINLPVAVSLSSRGVFDIQITLEPREGMVEIVLRGSAVFRKDAAAFSFSGKTLT